MRAFARHRALWMLLAAFAVILLGWAQAAPALAESPVDMGDQRVVDHSGTLSEDQVKDLTDQIDGSDLYAVYVESFDGIDHTQWCIQTAQSSSLNSRAVLLVVATGDRKFDLCAGSDVELTSSQRQAVGDAAKAKLASDDWAGAAVAAADELKTQEAGGSSGDNSSSSTSSDSDSDALFWGIVVLIAIIVVVVIIIVKRRHRENASTSRPTDPGPAARPATRTVEDVTQRVVAVDDSVRQAHEDLDFAGAELGQEKAGPFAEALRRAEAQRDAAWQALRQAKEKTPGPEQQQLLEQADVAAQQAGQFIAAQTQAFAEARSVQERAGEQLSQALAQIQDMESQVQQARDELGRLHRDFPTTSFTSLDDNPDQAERLLATAKQTASDGKQAWDKGDRQRAVGQLTITQRALVQADNQVGQVLAARETLGDANRALLREISALGNDLDDADRLARDSQALQPLVAEAKQAIDQANQARSGQGDVFAALERMTDANAAIDEALEPFRSADEAARKATESVRSRLDPVTRRVSEAENYISAHRGVVGSLARDRANEARAQLDEARRQLDSDPVAADAALRDASRMAGEALSRAMGDVANAQLDFPADANGGYGMRRTQTSGGLDLTSLILGGILGSNWSGGSYDHNYDYDHDYDHDHHSQSHHNSSWGSFGGGGFSGGFGGGGFGGGSFGGGSSSGGGFSGGFGGGSF